MAAGLALLVLSACSGGGGGNTPLPPAAPTITSFTASPSTITQGQTAQLTAVFSNGTGIIDNAVGTVSSGVAINVTPSATTTYTLTVTNSASISVTRIATLTVDPPPTITSFTASPSTITQGQTAQLTAVFSNGTGIIDNAVGTVTSGVAVNVTPTATTTYTLTVTNSATAAVTCTTTLAPIFANANSVNMNNGAGTVTTTTVDTVISTVTMAHTLTLEGVVGPATATATVTVTPGTPLNVTSFTATPTIIHVGQSAMLMPVFINATSASIDNGVGAVTSGTGYTVMPTATTTYTLTANGTGGPVTRAVTVTVTVAGEYAQQGPKLVGTGAGGGARQGQSVSFSADGNTAIVGGPTDNVGAGAAWIWTRSGGVWTQQGTKLVGSSAVGTYVNQGMSVSLSADGNTAIVGGPIDNSGVGAAWVWTRSGEVWTQQGPKLVGSDAVGNAFQGWSVSLSADGNTAIVGGGGDDNGGTGAAWVWTRSGGVWTQQGPKLVGSGASGNSRQGISVSLSTDGNTAIVGGYGDNSFAGAAWVWTRSGGVWTQQGTKLVGSGAIGNAYQGWSVSLSADGNTAIVGASGNQINGTDGAAWVWTRSGGVWTQQGPKLVGSGAVGSANQGYSVSLSGDGNTAIVGGRNDNNYDGAAWVWTRSGGVWTQQGPKLVGSDAVWHVAQQGTSVSLSSDGDMAIVGGQDDQAGNGAAWVWTRSGGVWTQEGPKLVGSGAVGLAWQGDSVSLSLDGDTAIVGGYNDNNGDGAAWVWTRSGGVWTQEGPKLAGAGAVDSFPAQQGYSVSISADGNTALIGGPADNNNAGAAWVWTRSRGVWTQEGPKLVGSGAVGNAIQGYSVALSADGNTAIVGGPKDNLGAGAEWIWTRSGGVWTQQGPKLVGSGAVGNAVQGNSVSLAGDGNTAIVGGYWDSGRVGAAWVWTRSGGVWTQQGAKLVGSGAVGPAQQGYSVSLSADGSTAIVGGNGDNWDNGGPGAAWIWTRSGGVWTQQGRKLVGTGAVGPAQQGRSVSLSGDGNTAIVGASQDNDFAGAAWVWTRSGEIWTQKGSKLVGSDAAPPSQYLSVSLSADGNTAIIGGNEDNHFTGAAWVFTR